MPPANNVEAVILSGAEQDIQAAYNRMLDRSERRAERFLETLEQSLAILLEHPEMGRRFPGSSLRSWSLHPFPYRLFYKLHGRRLMAGALLDMRQDAAAIVRQLQNRTLLDD